MQLHILLAQLNQYWTCQNYTINNNSNTVQLISSVKHMKALTHSLCNSLNELGYQFLSRGDEGLLLAQTLQVVSQ